MGREGREPANLPPDWVDELAKYGAAEKPLSSDDMTGGVPPERFRRHLALTAWKCIADYGSAKEPLPDWVVGYLKAVASHTASNLAPKGELSREDASSALGNDGEAGPEHSPIAVYLAMQEWIYGAAWPEVTGPSALRDSVMNRLPAAVVVKVKLARSSSISLRSGRSEAKVDSALANVTDKVSTIVVLLIKTYCPLRDQF